VLAIASSQLSRAPGKMKRLLRDRNRNTKAVVLACSGPGKPGQEGIGTELGREYGPRVVPFPSLNASKRRYFLLYAVQVPSYKRVWKDQGAPLHTI